MSRVETTRGDLTGELSRIGWGGQDPRMNVRRRDMVLDDDEIESV